MSYAESRRKWAIAKDGTQLKAADGHVMTKQEAIATNLINLAMNRRSSESSAESHSGIAESRQSSPTGNGIPYSEIVEKARLYILTLGGFEKFAEWGLIRVDRESEK